MDFRRNAGRQTDWKENIAWMQDILAKSTKGRKCDRLDVGAA
jgi:hypothetical protein